MSKAKPSTRSSGHVTLTGIGLVTIPLTIYSGTDKASGVERHEYLPVPVMEDDGNGKQVQKTTKVTKEDGTIEEAPVFEDRLIGRGNIDKTTGELLTLDQKPLVQKKIETEYGPVYVEDHEIEKLFTLEPDTLKVLEFQPQHLFHQGNYVPKDILHLEPAKTGSGAKKQHMPMAVKLLATLLKGMREEGTVAVCELTTRGVPKPCILTPDGALWLVYHTNAVREQRELPEVETVEAEVNMMRGLISALTKTEVRDLSDTRSELVQNFANEKAAAGDFGKTTDTYVSAAPAEPALDLMAMLAASVEQAKTEQAEAV